MTDEVLAVKYSPNHRFLAVALLDATVRIFYQDTLKFFLSLYGHKVCHTSPSRHPLISTVVTCPFSRHIVRFKTHHHILSR